MNNKLKNIVTVITVVASCNVFAAVTPQEAQALKNDLTPLGAERAGNADGSIPAWDGGLTAEDVDNPNVQPRVNYFSGDDVQYVVNNENLSDYESVVSDGIAALIKKYPDTFYLNVYETRRTAAAPEWVYENTFKNATRTIATNDGNSIENAFGGTPFPIPQTGAEVMWNHLLRWRGESVELNLRVWVGSTDGKTTLAVAAKDDHQFPYYDSDGTIDDFNGVAFMLRQVQTEPAFKSGESLLIHDPLDQVGEGRKAWQYLAGQRRVRRAPTVAFDTPDFVASGQNYFDEVFLFYGSLERYNWELIGKQEMLIPYNNNEFLTKSTEEVLDGHHLNSEHMRWEKHRVWVVEATLAPGERHVVPKKRFYIDEDSWSVVSVNGFDANGELWRVQHAVPFAAPDIPAVVSTTFALFNLPANTWIVNNLYNDQSTQYMPVRPRPSVYFTPDALAGSGIR
jgi:hypothetical protein